MKGRTRARERPRGLRKGGTRNPNRLGAFACQALYQSPPITKLMQAIVEAEMAAGPDSTIPAVQLLSHQAGTQPKIEVSQALPLVPPPPSPPSPPSLPSSAHPTTGSTAISAIPARRAHVTQRDYGALSLSSSEAEARPQASPRGTHLIRSSHCSEPEVGKSPSVVPMSTPLAM
jgi:hypothetical protein